MLIREIISVAINALRVNKLRSLLTMLGIVIGVGAVIAMVALGRGAQNAVNERISALGTTLLTINPGQVRRAALHRRPIAHASLSTTPRRSTEHATADRGGRARDGDRCRCSSET